MRSETQSVGSWAVPIGGDLVVLHDADAVLLLTAASGLAGALVQAGDVSLAIRVANAYLKMSVDHGGSPISALAHVTTSTRDFSGVCLTEALAVRVEGELLNIPVRLIRSVAGSMHKRRWHSAGRANVELIDGSSYKQVEIETPRQLSVLTLLGCQSVDVAKPGVAVRGHSVREISELRDRMEATLERYQQAFLQRIGPATFNRFFRRAA